MKIQSIQIHNFRNLQNVVIKPTWINILTWRNWGGKTNLLRAIAHSLETDLYLWQYFEDNVVTYWPWKKTTKIYTEVSNIPIRYKKDGDIEILEKYDKILFQNIISAWSNKSKKHLLSAYYKRKDFLDWNLDKAFQELFRDNKNIKPVELYWSADKFAQIWNEDINQQDIRNERDSKSTITDKNEGQVLRSLKWEIVTSFIERRSEDWIYEPEISSKVIYDFVTKIPKTQLAFEQIIKRLKRKKWEHVWYENFNNATFPLILADIQRSKKVSEFRKDLALYTDWLVQDIYINTHWNTDEKQIWTIWTPFIVTPNAPKELSSISMGTAIMVFFITIKNWLNLEYEERSYTRPGVILLDEVDSLIHPMLLAKLSEVLTNISKTTQLFITTHSPIFIDQFKKENIYYIKPVEKIGKISINRSDVYSYKEILDQCSPEDRKNYEEKKNSSLFIDGLIDDMYPIK